MVVREELNIRFFYVFLPFFSEIYPTINWVGLVKVLLWNWRDWKSWIWPTTKSAVSTEMPWQVSEVFVTCKFPNFLSQFLYEVAFEFIFSFYLSMKIKVFLLCKFGPQPNQSCWQKCPCKSQKSVSSPFFWANSFMKSHLNFHLPRKYHDNSTISLKKLTDSRKVQKLWEENYLVMSKQSVRFFSDFWPF